MPSFFCIASRVMPLVSGKTNNTTKNCTAIMTAKNANGTQIYEAVSWGNTTDSPALMIQWLELPKLWPLERTEFGKTSLMYTQMTAPDDRAKEAMNPANGQGRKTPTRSRPGDGWKWSAYAIAELLKFFDHARCARAFGLGTYRRTPFFVADPFVQNQPKHSA